MSKNINKAIIILISVIIVMVAVIATFYILKEQNQSTIKDDIENVFVNQTFQNTVIANEEKDKTKESEDTAKDDLVLQIDGENVIGVLTIEKIGFRGLVYEGTLMSTLDKGIGHFENTPYYEGNVGFAGHNSEEIWANLHELENGDIITYTSFLGARQYKVCNLQKIDETDWSLLENTEKNFITLITCVRNEPFKRLAVQAIEVD